MSPEMEDALRRALELTPLSLRALAREAGLSHSLLAMVLRGERPATPETVEAVAAALERLAERHTDAARILRDTQQREATDE